MEERIPLKNGMDLLKLSLHNHNWNLKKRQQILFTWDLLHAVIAQLIHYHKKIRAYVVIAVAVVCMFVSAAFNFLVKNNKI